MDNVRFYLGFRSYIVLAHCYGNVFTPPVRDELMLSDKKGTSVRISSVGCLRYFEDNDRINVLWGPREE